MNVLTQDVVRKLLHYDPDTGLFRNKVRRSSRSAPGQIIGVIDGKGYLHTTINGKFYRLHQLAFLYMTGEIPKFIDHIDRVRTNNSWANLRPTDCKGNAGNSGIPSHNKSGYRGVSQNSNSEKWHAQIKINGKQTYLGRFNTPKEAAVAYNNAAMEHFGEFATINP